MDPHWLDPTLGVPSPALHMRAGAGDRPVLQPHFSAILPNSEPRRKPHLGGSNPRQRDQYICLVPHCGSCYADVRALDQHYKTHHAAPAVPNAGYAYAVGNGYAIDAVAFAPPAMNNGYAPGGLLLPQTAHGYGAPLDITVQRDHPPQIANPPAGAGYTISLDPAPSHLLDPSAPWTLGVTPSTSTAAPTPNPPPPPTIGPGPRTTPLRHPCPTCTTTFARPSDLLRHARTHDPLAMRYGCEVPGCKYVGGMGFVRKDKLASHVRSRHG